MPNDQVEGGGCAASNEGTSSESSTPSDANRSYGPRSLQPIVRRMMAQLQNHTSKTLRRHLGQSPVTLINPRGSYNGA